MTDVYLYDRGAGQIVPAAELNSKHLDAEPSLSGDGDLLALASDRPGGSGGRDIYLYQRSMGKSASRAC